MTDEPEDDDPPVNWPEVPTVDLPETEDLILYGPTGEVLSWRSAYLGFRRRE